MKVNMHALMKALKTIPDPPIGLNDRYNLRIPEVRDYSTEAVTDKTAVFHIITLTAVKYQTGGHIFYEWELDL